MTTTSVPDLHTSIHDVVRSSAADLLTASRAIHALAEIGFEEVESSRLLSGLIAQRGFQVELGVSGMPTAFVARRGRSGPHVAFLCEYDALRGLGHACGHNLIATSSAGAGIALAESLAGSRCRCARDHRRHTGGGGWRRQDPALPRRPIRRLRCRAHLPSVGPHRIRAVRARVHALGMDVPWQGRARCRASRPRHQRARRVCPGVQRRVAVAAAAARRRARARHSSSRAAQRRTSFRS